MIDKLTVEHNVKVVDCTGKRCPLCDSGVPVATKYYVWVRVSGEIKEFVGSKEEVDKLINNFKFPTFDSVEELRSIIAGDDNVR